MCSMGDLKVLSLRGDIKWGSLHVSRKILGNFVKGNGMNGPLKQEINNTIGESMDSELPFSVLDYTTKWMRISKSKKLAHYETKFRFWQKIKNNYIRGP